MNEQMGFEMAQKTWTWVASGCIREMHTLYTRAVLLTYVAPYERLDDCVIRPKNRVRPVDDALTEHTHAERIETKVGRES